MAQQQPKAAPAATPAPATPNVPPAVVAAVVAASAPLPPIAPASKGRAVPAPGVVCGVPNAVRVAVGHTNGQPTYATLPYVVPPGFAGNKAGQPVAVSHGAPGIYWLGANGAPLVAHVCTSPGGAVVLRATPAGVVATAYPTGYAGGSAVTAQAMGAQ